MNSMLQDEEMAGLAFQDLSPADLAQVEGGTFWPIVRPMPSRTVICGTLWIDFTWGGRLPNPPVTQRK